MEHKILRYFKYDHLSDYLGEYSKLFSDLAQVIAAKGKDPAETTVALRKLLEAKDAAVRSIFE